MRMEERRLTQLKDENSIFYLLQEFAPFLKTLQQGEDYQREMSKKFSKYAELFVLSINKKNAGFIAFYANDTKKSIAFLSMIAVLDSYQRLGLGQALLDVALEKSKKRGMQKLQLQVRKDNIKALAFYQKNNFNVFSETEDYYYMAKELTE